MPFRWEPDTGASGRYRDERSGRFVSGATVRRELDRYLDANDPARSLAGALRRREINVADWEIGMRRHIKNTHLNAIALERGGWANMRPSDYGRAGQIIREQYGYLKRFAGQIADGTQKLDGRLDVRAGLYTQAGRESFYKSKHANLREGVDMVRSIRHARDSCRECIDLEGKWFRVGDPAYKLPGDRICSKNCHCSEAYGRMTADGGVEEIESGAPPGSVGGRAVRLAERTAGDDMADMVDLLTDEELAKLEAQRQKLMRGDPVALAKALKQVEPAMARLKDYEVAYVFDSDGQLILQKKGGAHEVAFTREELSSNWAWGTVTHNHPGGNSFSGDDVRLLADRKMRSIRAVGIKNGRRVTYDLTVIDEEFYENWYLVPFRYQLANDDIYEEIGPLFRNGTITEDEANELHPHRVMERFVERMTETIGKPVLRYTRTFEE